MYGGDRSCRLVTVDGAISCRFFLGQAQVAHGTDLDDVPAAVAAWISTRVPVRLLAAHAPAVQLEPHAEVLETDPPRWQSTDHKSAPFAARPGGACVIDITW